MPVYKGTFNWYGEIIVLKTTKAAMNKGVAYRHLTHGLSKRLGRTQSSIKAYFNGEKDNFKIEEVKE